MTIYGVALLAACTVLGVFLGEALGAALHVKANVGGVGIAMLLGNNSSSDRLAIVLRLKLHLVTIVFFALGGVFGVLGYQHLGGLSFCALAMPLLLLSIRYLR